MLTEGRTGKRLISPHLWLIKVIGVIVPRRLRADWRQEWEAELRHREQLLANWDHLNFSSKLELMRRSFGAMRDALWLQTFRWEDEMVQDVRYGIRMILKSPGFTMIAVLTLALGIGANTAIFQLLDAVRMRSLPVQAPEELAEVRVADMTGARGNFNTWYPSVTNPIWEELRERQQAFSGIFAWGTDGFDLTPGGEVRTAKALWVSGDFFNVLGIRPVLGRVFTEEDDQRGCGEPGVVISHSFWRREFGGDASIIGREITLDDRPFEIIGVTPSSFFGLEVGRSFDVALPICAEAIIGGKNNRLDKGTEWWLSVTGRLKPGWSHEEATAHVQTISPDLFRTTLPANYPPVSVGNYLGFKLETVPARGGISLLREDYEWSLWVLLAITGLVLLIACANLANLLLARASTREREVAVRQALGATRGRLIRQMLIESLLLAGMGAGAGALLAQTLSQALVAFLSTDNDRVFLDLGPDWRLLGFAALLAILTCVLFGLMPALRAARIEPGAVMKSSGRGVTAGRERFSMRRILVVVQVALSLVLVAGALLFSRSLGKLQTVETGFQKEGVLIASVGFTRLDLPHERRVEFKGELLDRIRAIPGVEAVSETSIIPISGSASANNIWMDGTDPQQRKNTNLSQVGPDYFRTLGTPLLAGRDFDERDSTSSPKVAIVNEAFTRSVLNGASAVGQRFWIEATPSDPETLYEIVGVVKDTKYTELSEKFEPIIFRAASQNPRPASGGHFLIRSSLPQSGIVGAVKRVLGEINPAVSVSFKGFEALIEATILRERLLATLSGFFGLLALLLACIGLYGILSYTVASRTNEIGIRMALGAQPRKVLWLILREALLLVIVGLASGLPLIVAASGLASSLLFGLTPTDPVSLSLAGVLMFLVAVIAGYMPARRATRLDPVEALRHE